METVPSSENLTSPQPIGDSPLLAEEQSQWLPRILEEDPSLLALRERALAWTGGISFANMVHTALSSSPVVFNRHAILQLIYNHLLSLGMERTAEIIEKETGHKFQIFDEPWDRTGLMILVSLGILPRENPWNIPYPPNCRFIEESLEEDFFACQYRENPRDIYQELLDKNLNVNFDSNEHSFKHITTCSLKRLIVIVVTCTDVMDHELMFKEDDLSGFFLTLHSLTSSEHFFDHLKAIFDFDFSDEKAISRVQTLYPRIQYYVARVLQKWLRFHGLFIGKKTLKLIEQFSHRVIEIFSDEYQPEDPINEPDQRSPNSQTMVRKECVKIFKSLIDEIPTLTYGQKLDKIQITDDPIITDPQIILSPQLTILDPDPTEVARQITLLSYKAFSAIHSREFMVAISKKTVTIQTPTLAEFFEFSDKIERVTLESIARARDPVSAVSTIVKIAVGLEKLSNFDALYRVLAALTIPQISILTKAADVNDIIKRLSSKTGSTPETNEWYSQQLESHFEQSLPAIPNMSAELKFSPTINEPDFTNSLMINWAKRQKIGRRMIVFYKLQNCPYRYWEVPQIQKIFSRGSIMSDQELGARISKISSLKLPN